MADDYRIVGRIVVEDHSAPGIAGAHQGLDAVERHATRSGVSITHAFTRAFAIIGGTAGIGMAVRGILKLHSAIEDATGGMASLLSVQTGAPITEALGQARELVQGLRKDAAVGVGELGNYVQGLQSIMGPGLAAGGSLDQLRELNRLALSAGYALRGQEGLNLAPMDITQALTGGASRIETPIVTQALQAMGVTAEAFNRMNPGRRMETLLEAFGKFGPGVELMGKGWNAQLSTLKDNVKTLVTDITKPLFDRWAEQLRAANAWVERNKDSIANIVETWGPRLVTLWDDLIDRAGTYAGLIGAAAMAPNVVGITSGAARGGGLAGLLGGGGAAAGAAGGVGLGGLLTVMAVLAQAAGTAAIWFFSIKGAFERYPGLLSLTQQRLGGLWMSLQTLWSTISWFLPSWEALNKGLALGGAGLILVLDGLTFALQATIKWIDTVATAWRFLLQELWLGIQRSPLFGRLFKNSPSPTREQDIADDFFTRMAQIWTIWDRPRSGPGVADEFVGPVWDPAKRTVASQNVNIGAVHIHNDVKTLVEPRVLAKSFEAVLDDLARYRVGAVRVPSLQGA